ncbi:hypothetical protein [Nostoc sp.]|uniref:hypothetical protein n=1 Tax=Nostoc sp. TaxID=1180 RepID=UPI002FF632CF
MALLTIQELFGANVVETSTTITIYKANLLGLTPLLNNTADSLFAGIINTVHQQYEGQLTDENGLTVTDQNNIPVTYDNHLFYSSTWVQFWGYLFPKGKLNSCFLFSQVKPYENI